MLKDPSNPFPGTSLGALYAARGDNDLAFEWLAKNKNVPRRGLEFDLFFKNLRDDPRWIPYLDSLDEMFGT